MWEYIPREWSNEALVLVAKQIDKSMFQFAPWEQMGHSCLAIQGTLLQAPHTQLEMLPKLLAFFTTVELK